MKGNTFRIASFPQDDRLWRVDWFGKLVLNPNNLSEPQVQVFISPFNSFPEDPAANKAVNHNERAAIQIGVGQLPLVHVGSAWRNGQLYPIHELNYKSEIFESLTISAETLKVVKANHKVDGSYIIDPRYFPIGSANGLSARCLCVKHQNDPFGLIIPMMELIRFYYSTSTKLARILLNGSFSQSVDVLYNPARSFLDEDGFCLIWLRKDFDDLDAWTTARIAFSGIAQTNAKLIHESALRNLHSGERSAYPETFPPFEGSTRLKAYGKRVRSGDKWRFLVFWLSSCNFPFPYIDLSAGRDNDGNTSENNDNNREDAFPNGRKNLQPLPGEDALIHDNEETSSEQIPFVKELSQQRFPYLAGKELIDLPKERCNYKSGRKQPVVINEDQSMFSTGGKTYGETSTSPLNIRLDQTLEDSSPERRAPSLPKSFENFIAGLKAISVLGDIEFKIVPASQDTVRHAFGIASLFPVRAHGQRLPFAYLKFRPVGERKRRQALIAEVRLDSWYFYFLEIQQRDTDNFTSLLLYDVRLGRLDANRLGNILLCCAKKSGRWLDDIDVPNVGRARLPHKWKSAEEFASKALKLMNDAMRNSMVR